MSTRTRRRALAFFCRWSCVVIALRRWTFGCRDGHSEFGRRVQIRSMQPLDDAARPGHHEGDAPGDTEPAPQTTQPPFDDDPAPGTALLDRRVADLERALDAARAERDGAAHAHTPESYVRASPCVDGTYYGAAEAIEPDALFAAVVRHLGLGLVGPTAPTGQLSLLPPFVVEEKIDGATLSVRRASRGDPTNTGTILSAARRVLSHDDMEELARPWRSAIRFVRRRLAPRLNPIYVYHGVVPAASYPSADAPRWVCFDIYDPVGDRFLTETDRDAECARIGADTAPTLLRSGDLLPTDRGRPLADIIDDALAKAQSGHWRPRFGGRSVRGIVLKMRLPPRPSAAADDPRCLKYAWTNPRFDEDRARRPAAGSDDDLGPLSVAALVERVAAALDTDARHRRALRRAEAAVDARPLRMADVVAASDRDWDAEHADDDVADQLLALVGARVRERSRQGLRAFLDGERVALVDDRASRIA